jgi:uncharacterized membrane protein
MLLATFAFCVLALTDVDTSAVSAPTLTLQLSLILAFSSVLTNVAYFNRITRQQYVGRIMERIAGETQALVSQLPYGQNVGVRVGIRAGFPTLTRWVHRRRYARTTSRTGRRDPCAPSG